MKKTCNRVLLVVLVCAMLCTSAFAAQAYTVAKGDSMWKVAQKYGVTLSQLAKANPQVKDPSRIYPGQVLTVPTADTAAQPAAPASPQNGTAGTAAGSSAVTSKLDGVSGIRVKELPGYQMVDVPTDVISYENDVVMNYIQEFANITQVPHTSYHTEKITQYLKVWAAARNITCETEEIGNVVMYVPATAGYEDSPTVIFQGHIDMVPALDAGVEHDWDNDALDLLWSSNSVKADGTSLGADDGSGLAFMLTYMDYEKVFVHGPLRFVFTVDEEVGLLGAHALDAKHLEGADYMINVDGGYGSAIISCAGGKYYDFTRAAEWVEAPADTVAYTLSFSGLKGGHSAGVGNGKANALVAMANALLELDQADLAFGICSFTGGSASNAIPKDSKAVVALKSSDVAAADALLKTFAKKFSDSYSAIETEYTFTYGKTGMAEQKMLTPAVSRSLVQLMSCVPNNIHTLLATAKGTEASSNLGTISLTEETVNFRCLMRSSSTYQAEQMTLTNTALAKLSGFTLDIPGTFATWPLKGNNVLGEIAAELFQERTGEEYALNAIHAGVECGEFAEKDESLYIISTGVSGGSNGHTTAESMNFDKVEVSIDFLVALAEKLASKS